MLQRAALGVLVGAVAFSVYATLSLWGLSASTGVFVNPFINQITVGVHQPLAVVGAFVALASVAAVRAAMALRRVASAAATITAAVLAVTSSLAASGDPLAAELNILERIWVAGGQSGLSYVAAGVLLSGVLLQRHLRPAPESETSAEQRSPER